MEFAEIYKKYGADLSSCNEYKGTCRDLSLLAPYLFLPLLKEYLLHFNINIFDFIDKGLYNYLIHEGLESSRKVDMLRKIFSTYYLYLKEMEKRARSKEMEVIKKLTWK